MKVMEKYLTMTIAEQTEEFKKHCGADVEDCDLFNTCDECHVQHLNSEFVERTPLEIWGSELIKSNDYENIYQQGDWKVIVSRHGFCIECELAMGEMTKDYALAIIEEMEYISKKKKCFDDVIDTE